MICPKCHKHTFVNDYCDLGFDTVEWAIDYNICLRCGYVEETSKIKVVKVKHINIWSKEGQELLKKRIEKEERNKYLGAGI